MRFTPKQAFLTGDRRLEVYFYTSNIGKFLQARLLFGQAGLQLRHFRARTDPYTEEYHLGKDELLRRAVREVYRWFPSDVVFFVEDTSLRIEALSGAGADVPGLRVKEWFESANFTDVDRALREGGDRRATVKSDIALHIPHLDDVVFFRGETSGAVADSPAETEASAQYPWLGPNNFNGWFIPDGATKRLAEMDLETSLEYDFRAKAMVPLIDRLAEYSAILNLSSAGFRRRIQSQPRDQELLFSSDRKPFVVIGRTCSGKTTFAEQAVMHHERQHVEASSVVRMLAQQTASSSGEALQTANALLQERGPDVVAREILNLYESTSDGLVVTGFRKIEELVRFCEANRDTVVVWIEASERTRFERNLERGRYNDVSTLEKFRELDQGQMTLGLLRVAEDVADVIITNEESLADYRASVSGLLDDRPSGETPLVRWLPRFEVRRQRSQLFRCLQALVGQQALTSREIAKRTGELSPDRPVATRNVNMTLKEVPELAKRYTRVGGDEFRYEITPSGVAYVRFIELRSGT